MSQGVGEDAHADRIEQRAAVAGSAVSSTFTCSVAAISFGLAVLRDHA